MITLRHQKSFVFILIIGMFVAFQKPAWGEIIRDGDVIDSGNIERYKEYFPEYMGRYVKDGWGFEKPVVIHVAKHEKLPVMAPYLEASKNNVGKVTLKPDGTLAGHNVGFPFPDPDEPNKALKIMWNQYFRPIPDDYKIPENFLMFSKRKGGSVNVVRATYDNLKFSGRTMVEPLPELQNPKGLFWSTILNFKSPPNKDMATLTWRYKDPQKHDDMWTYIPTLRRTLRMVSSERANPIQGTPMSWDDIFGFDGKILQFDYQLKAEQKVFALVHMKKTADELPNQIWEHPIIYGQDEPYELVDTYVIEIKSKDPRYPESRRLVWVLKETFWVIYAETFDKGNKFWKGYFGSTQVRPIGEKEYYAANIGTGITDFKTEYWVLNYLGKMDMNIGLNPSLFEPSSLGTF